MRLIDELKEKTKVAREKIRSSAKVQDFIEQCKRLMRESAERGFDHADVSFQYIDEEEEETLLLADICIQVLEEDYGFKIQRGVPYRINPFGYRLTIRLFWS